eukprot:TRINITY_DN3771_c0_g1_i11.p1 TRINITY_DN3771_c0_g1~~TRINITY_DN3771_c0_g1_i11.p1  ORF type:complete len:243 (+),score=47.86 TRINITY_DN3771_c0_g1_i11:341-1069(+)
MALSGNASVQAQDEYKVALQCGITFAKDYYLKYARSPEDLAAMYGAQCNLCHHVVGEAPARTTGVQEVTAYLREHVVPEAGERKIALDALDCTPSAHGSVLLVAKGCILTKGSTQEFHQSFLLGKFPNSDHYYIVNDTMQKGPVVKEQGAQSPDHGEEIEVAAEGPAAAKNSPRSPPRAAPPKQAAEPAAPWRPRRRRPRRRPPRRRPRRRWNVLSSRRRSRRRSSPPLRSPSRSSPRPRPS